MGIDFMQMKNSDFILVGSSFLFRIYLRMIMNMQKPFFFKCICLFVCPSIRSVLPTFAICAIDLRTQSLLALPPG